MKPHSRCTTNPNMKEEPAPLGLTSIIPPPMPRSQTQHDTDEHFTLLTPELNNPIRPTPTLYLPPHIWGENCSKIVPQSTFGTRTRSTSQIHIQIENKLLLSIHLNTPATVGKANGSQIRIYFDSLLDIQDAVMKIFGSTKLKIVIPESQDSSLSLKCKEVSDGAEARLKNPCLLTASVNRHNEDVGDTNDHSKLVTPIKKKVSEARMIIPVLGVYKLTNPPTAANTPLRHKGRVKPRLEMISSAERSTGSTSSTYKKMKLGNDFEIMKMDESLRSPEEKAEIVLDTQPVSRMEPNVLLSLSGSFLTEQKHDLGRKKPRCEKAKFSVSEELVCNQGVGSIVFKPHSSSSVSERRQFLKQPVKATQKLHPKAEGHKYPNQNPRSDCVSYNVERSAEIKKYGNEQSLQPETSVKNSNCSRTNGLSRIDAQNASLLKSIGKDSDKKEASQLHGSKQSGLPPVQSEKEKFK
ncbi:Hypothetical predicted protein [Pelobates cultripes]|uniref:Uncharacterized protein n=1 Tax=Pelobates cultripes TaxID=61616 RepID=A0AAD1SMQ2_PELCU|nr:Hypothetical predicted protein [Pelobates cultripes]